MLFVKDQKDGYILATGTKSMGSLYDEYADVDGLLYLVYRSEDAFGLSI